jgi:hypothetical protein
LRRLAAALIAATLAAPAAAVAQAPPSPLSPGLPVPTGPAPPTTTTPAPLPSSNPTTPGGSGLSGSTALIIAIGAIALIAGIGLFIWRDARRRAPVRHAHATAGVGARSGSKRPIKPRKLSPAERRRRKRGRAR